MPSEMGHSAVTVREVDVHRPKPLHRALLSFIAKSIRTEKSA